MPSSATATGTGDHTRSNATQNATGSHTSASNTSRAGGEYTGPASHTNGPHSSNIKNILDPRYDANDKSAEVAASARAEAKAEAEREQREREKGSGIGGVKDAVKNIGRNVHGAGENLRGKVNAGVDRKVGKDEEAARRHDATAREGGRKIAEAS